MSVTGLWFLTYSYFVSMRQVQQYGTERKSALEIAATTLEGVDSGQIVSLPWSQQSWDLKGAEKSLLAAVNVSSNNSDQSKTPSSRQSDLCVNFNNLCVIETLLADTSGTAEERALHLELAQKYVQESKSQLQHLSPKDSNTYAHIPAVLDANEKLLEIVGRR